MNYYPFNIADYRKDTQGLMPIEHYIYRTLLDECYLTEMPLNPDIRELMRDLRLPNDQKSDLEYVLDKFFELTENGYVNHRVTFELSKTYERSEKARASANRRWHKSERKATAKKNDANALRTHSKGNADGMLPYYPTTLIPQDSSANRTTSKARKKRAAPRFKPPTPDEVQVYLDERSITSFTGQTFCDFYEARGWELSNGKKMKDWRAAVRTWENRRRDQDNDGGSNFGSGTI